MKELYAGVDIHRDNYVGCIIDNEGKIVMEKPFLQQKKGFRASYAHHLAYAAERRTVPSCCLKQRQGHHCTLLGFEPLFSEWGPFYHFPY